MKKLFIRISALVFILLTILASYSYVVSAATSTTYPKLTMSSSVSATNVYQYDTISLAVSARGGSGNYKYQYIYSSPDDTNDFAWSIAGWEDKSVETFKPTAVGVYTFKITVWDKKAGESLDEIHTIRVSAPPEQAKLRISSGVSPNPAYVNEAVTCTVNATSGSGDYEYAFYYKAPGGNQDYYFPGTNSWSSVSTRSFVGTTKGVYKITCNVRDKKTGDVVKSIHDVEFKEKTIISNGKTDRSEIIIGDKVRLTAAASGSTGSFTYKMTYSLDGGAAQTIQDYSANKSRDFTPTKAGDYTITFSAKSSSGATATNTVNLTVKNIQSTAKISKNSCYQGEEIELTAGASGGYTPYQHRFEYEDSKGNTTVISDYGKSASAIFSTETPGKYIITILTKDAKSNVTSQSFAVDVKKYQPKATVKFDNDVLLMSDGTTFKGSITPSGGAAPYTYLVNYIKNGGQVIKVSDKGSFSWTPTPTIAGDYKLQITVKDKFGNVALNNEEYTLSLINQPYTRDNLTAKITDVENHLKEQGLSDIISTVSNAAKDNTTNYITDIFTKHENFSKLTTDENRSVRDFLTNYYNAKKALLDDNKTSFNTEYTKLSNTFSEIEAINFIQLENPSIISVFRASVINSLNYMMGVVPAALTDGGKAFGLGLDYEWFANEYSGMFNVIATMFVVLFLAVNLLESTVQFELFTIKGGAKFAAKLVLCKVWIDLATKICIMIAKIGTEMLGGVLTAAAPNIDVSHMNIADEAKSGIPVIGPIIDFLNGIFSAGELIPLVLIILILIMVLKVVIKLVIRTFEIGMLTVVSPIFFGAWVGDATKPYFKKFISALIGLVTDLVYMGLIYFIFMKWVEYSYSSLNGAELPLHFFNITDPQTMVIAYLLVALATLKMMYKPPEVIRNLFLR